MGPNLHAAVCLGRPPATGPCVAERCQSSSAVGQLAPSRSVCLRPLQPSRQSAKSLVVKPRGSRKCNTGVRSAVRCALAVGSETRVAADGDDPVQAVLFDMDGVLCNSEDRSREAAVELFREMGVSVTAEDFIPFMGTGEANFLGGVAGIYGVSGFDVVAAKKRFFEIYIEKFALPNSGLGYPGALELILACKAAGLKVALASSADRVKVDANLLASGLPLENFDAVVSADKFARLKPAPDIFLAAAKELKVEPGQCVVVEDALAGLQAAQAAGMRCICVSTTLPGQQLAEAGAALVKPSIQQLRLEDILGGGRGSQGGEPEAAERAASSTSSDSAPPSGGLGFLDAPIQLPGGFETTRRDVLRLGSLGVGLGSLSVLVTQSKTLSYVSPQALVRLISPLWERPLSAGAAEGPADRVKAFRGFLEELESRPGGTVVPEFAPRLAWLNTAPLRLQKDLRGRVVLLDFWTYCCINCIHVLPELAFLENKYKDSPVTVVGVHSAKFDNEKDLDAIRNAVLRYEITHPVVNDGNMTMWRALGVSSWPTIAVVSPQGRLIGTLAGENHRQDLDDLLAAAIPFYRERGELQEGALPLSLERDRDARLLRSPLRFPGKIATDLANGRLFISDSNNHRVVVTDLQGKFLAAVGGGGEGLRDGPFETALFNRPQGVAYDSARNMLFVADTENHTLREVDLGAETVRTVAGNGQKGSDYRGGGRGTSQLLNSPWDVAVDERAAVVFVAMAGQHQIWAYDIKAETARSVSGNGYERNQNGRDAATTAWAQPSGLAFTPGRDKMYVADSESSSIRTVDLKTGGAQLCAGGDAAFAENLFKFGDADGAGSRALLQHPLGVLCSPDGRVFIADSYNHRLKEMDPQSFRVTTVVGSGRAGFKDGRGTDAQLSEPAGLALGPSGTLLVADTNNSVVRVVDPGNGFAVSTLELTGVPPPRTAEGPGAPRRLRRRQALPEAEVVSVGAVAAQNGTLAVEIAIPKSYHFTQGATSRYEVDAGAEGVVEVEPASGVLTPNGLQTGVQLRFSRGSTGEATTVRVSCKVYYCQQDDLCLYKAVVFEVPFEKAASGESTRVELPFTVVPAAAPASSLASV